MAAVGDSGAPDSPGRDGSSRLSGLVHWVPVAWSGALALLVLGPALAPGYVLSYDMVWVPDLALRPDFLGVGSGLPRAVPSDAVVAVLDEVVPGMLLQKLMLLATLVAAGAGAAALVARLATRGGGPGLPAQCLAASFAVWNPFVVERLVIGHWPVLIGYAALPWLVLAARRHRLEGSPGLLLVLLPLGSLSASAGLASAVTVLVVGLARGRARANAVLVALVLASNAPWVLSGLLHAADATTDPAGAGAFALHGEDSLPAPLTALGLGGIWNAEVVPTTRDGVLAVVALVALLALAAAGTRAWWRATEPRDALALVGRWAVGYGLAMLGWAAPDAVGWLATNVPGGGLLRDTSRLLGLCVPLLVCLVAHGAARTAGLLRDPDQRVFVGGVLVLVPLSLMPDAGWGVSGRLGAVDYPASYGATRDAVGDGAGDDVLVLPFTSYRAPAWNDGRKVLDPTGRYLRPDFVASDELIVSGVTIAGEDPRGDDVRRALAAGSPGARQRALLRLGIGWTVTDSSAPGEKVAVDGDVVSREGDLETVRLGEADPQPVPAGWWVVMGLAWAAFLAPGVTWIIGRARHAVRRDASR